MQLPLYSTGQSVGSAVLQGQQSGEPSQQEPEVVTGGRQHRVGGIVGAAGEVVAIHAMAAFQMPDHRLDRPPAQRALDLIRDSALLPGGVDAKSGLAWGVVTPIRRIGDDAPQRRADL